MHAFCHFAAGSRAMFACFNAFTHTADFFAAVCTCLTNLCAHTAQLGTKCRAAEVKVGGRLANLCTTHHESKVLRFHVRTTYVKTMVQGHLLAGAMALHACFETRLHFLLGCGRILHGKPPNFYR
jgi:hypothetical protein